MSDLLRSGVGGSVLIWVAMCMVDPVLIGLVGTFDLTQPWTGIVFAGERMVWVIGQAAVLLTVLWVGNRSDGLVYLSLPAFLLLAMMGWGAWLPREQFWGLGLAEQVAFQAMLGVWLFAQRQLADRLAAGALFAASLAGLALMADAQMRMAGLEIVAGDPALAFTVAYGEWSAPIIPFIGVLLLAACAAYARRDPTWTPNLPRA